MQILSEAAESVISTPYSLREDERTCYVTLRSPGTRIAFTAAPTLHRNELRQC